MASPIERGQDGSIALTVNGAITVRLLDFLTPDSYLGKRWESLVQINPASGVMQSLAWAEVKRRQGLETVHFGLFQDEELIGGAIYFASRETHGTRILVAPEGPVLPWNDRKRSGEQLALLTAATESYASRHGFISMRIEPRLKSPPPACLREFGRAPIDLVPRQTLYLDLTMSEEALLAQMKPKGRYNINLAQRHAVDVIEYTDMSAVAEFYQALTAAGQRDQFPVEPRLFFDHLAAQLCSRKLATFFLAKHDGDLLGALLLITYGQRATYLYGGICDTKRNLMGGYALQWAAIRKARSAGCTTYDFYGYVPHRSPLHQYGRFSQFKSQFGGTPVRFIGAQDYFFLDQVADAFVKAVQEARPQANDTREASGASFASRAE